MNLCPGFDIAELPPDQEPEIPSLRTGYRYRASTAQLCLLEHILGDEGTVQDFTTSEFICRPDERGRCSFNTLEVNDEGILDSWFGYTFTGLTIVKICCGRFVQRKNERLMFDRHGRVPQQVSLNFGSLCERGECAW